ncbi:DNA polymerase-3 subunit delta' [Andreprevotia lacus DSM 23236]|jgi:DNA polymerase-3 subunit delta'|uniref:DNA polymerase-3 subunit delta n=1 Tax=Andreprevotia lacus DSM 23236 TaxID=1121001 RepID=A0A1W1X670_9NEIS|nr:DNA polymerase III subunit delta' [Andreprevotia lacus]SMC19459.1 DNA polymerase-3 subunit delta' [Andreprevotia lacus DSM 23236]
MSALDLYPWQHEAWAQLLHDPARLPHALLLTGEPGIGKRRFAERLAAWFLCEAADKALAPCGVCEGCRWQLAGNHPDFRLLSPEEGEAEEGEEGAKAKKKSAIINVENVRELTDFVQLTSHRRGSRVTLVVPAETMNTAAANAFLKTLEEPPEGARFILVSNHWRRLLPTIRSRCRVFALPQPDEDVATSWLTAQGVVDPALHLAHTGGAPLAALDDAAAEWLPQRNSLLAHLGNPGALDVLAVATEFDRAKVDMALLVEWLQKWVHDLVSLGLSGKIRYYPDCREALARLAPRAAGMTAYAERLLEARKLAHHPLNARLVIESLLFDYLAALKSAGSPR